MWFIFGNGWWGNVFFGGGDGFDERSVQTQYARLEYKKHFVSSRFLLSFLGNLMGSLLQFPSSYNL